MNKKEIIDRLTRILSISQALPITEDTQSSIAYINAELAIVTKELTEAKFTTAKDWTGVVLGHLTVLGFAGTVPDKNTKCGYRNQWRVKCDCGREQLITSDYLSLHERQLKDGREVMCSSCQTAKRRTIHGQSNKRVYERWTCMKQRCYYDKAPSFDNIGAKGITVCDEWLHNFEAFYKWAMSNGYEDTKRLVRVDKLKNYCPDNCVWIPNKYQDPTGNWVSLTDACKAYGLSYGTVCYRIKKNWPRDQWFITPKADTPHDKR